LDRHSKADRFAALQDAISLNTKHADTTKDRPIILLDDVMTSGATLAACSEVCLTADASRVDIVTLARVIKDA
jgi:predicted amidophosphoribosyltransferase